MSAAAQAAPAASDVNDNCPQVYQSKNVATRFNKSVKQYAALEKDRNFKDGFKPTGNITVSDAFRFGMSRPASLPRRKAGRAASAGCSNEDCTLVAWYRSLYSLLPLSSRYGRAS